MSTVMTWQTESTASEVTEQLAEQLGQQLRGGEVIELISDLGGGKTTFVRGLARGMGSTDRVSSPTFTVSKVYKSKDLELHHFDFYRLNDAGLMAYELQDVMDNPKAVVVIEWGNVAAHVLPEEHLTITIQSNGEEKRMLEFKYPQKYTYLMENYADIDT